jgi:hypothetical protein
MDAFERYWAGQNQSPDKDQKQGNAFERFWAGQGSQATINENQPTDPKHINPHALKPGFEYGQSSIYPMQTPKHGESIDKYLSGQASIPPTEKDGMFFHPVTGALVGEKGLEAPTYDPMTRGWIYRPVGVRPWFAAWVKPALRPYPAKWPRARPGIWVMELWPVRG